MFKCLKKTVEDDEDNLRAETYYRKQMQTEEREKKIIIRIKLC